MHRYLMGLLICLAACAPEPSQAPAAEEEPPRRERFSLALRQTIGDDDAFGVVSAVERVEGERTVVLDAMNGRVSLYGADGTLLDRFGRRGAGPGELRGARAVARTPGGELFVLDAGNSRMAVLAVRADTLALLREVPLPLPASDLCSLGQRLFVLGPHAGNLLHEVGPDGVILRSFAPADGADPFRAAVSGVGKLACDAASGQIAVAPRMLAEVAVYSESGELRRRDSIPRFAETVYRRTGNAVRPALPEAGFAHETAGVHWLEGGALLVQLRRRPDPGQASLESRLLVPGEGWIEKGPAWPLVLRAHGRDLWVAEADPTPRVNVYDVAP